MEPEATVIQTGWEIYSSDGERVGTVSAVEDDHLEMELEILGGSALAIPFDAVTAADSGRVELDVPASQVAQMGWEAAPGDVS
jgi:sporulation protein YlmC with PRC-barrel domain